MCKITCMYLLVKKGFVAEMWSKYWVNWGKNDLSPGSKLPDKYLMPDLGTEYGPMLPSQCPGSHALIVNWVLCSPLAPPVSYRPWFLLPKWRYSGPLNNMEFRGTGSSHNTVKILCITFDSSKTVVPGFHGTLVPGYSKIPKSTDDQVPYVK